MGRRSRKSKRRMNSLLLALLLTAVMLIMSTYAWFSANREVALTGITATVKAAEGLQISLDGQNWKSSIAVSQSVLSGLGTSVNNYVWPSELIPVSADGSINGNDARFVFGDINGEGNILNGIVNAPTSDGRYISFDLYFKNSSSQSAGDKLQLNTTSYVQIHTLATGEDATILDGKTGTGLENCVRAGVLLYDNSKAFTAAVSGENSIRAMGPGTTPLFAVWEPFYAAHIGEVVTNDARISAADSQFSTYAILAAGIGKNLKGVNGTSATCSEVDGNGDDIENSQGTYMTTLSTLTSTAGTVTTVTDVKAVDGTTQLMLRQNAIMKARIYIWLEGQDPDCNDTASTGKAFDIQLGFVKPAIVGP